MSTSVIVFPKHKMYRCPGDKPRCIEGRCVFCQGGLSYCERCQTGEVGLTEDCCGRPLTVVEHEQVCDGVLDYRRSQGGWTRWTRSREMAARTNYGDLS